MNRALDRQPDSASCVKHVCLMLSMPALSSAVMTKRSMSAFMGGMPVGRGQTAPAVQRTWTAPVVTPLAAPAARRCDRGGIHDRSPSDVLRISGPRRDVAQSREVLQEYNGTRPKRRNGGPPPRLAFVASVAARTGKPAAVSASAVALRVRSASGLSGAGATVIMSSRSAAYGGMRGQLGVSAIRE